MVILKALFCSGLVGLSVILVTLGDCSSGESHTASQDVIKIETGRTPLCIKSKYITHKFYSYLDTGIFAFGEGALTGATILLPHGNKEVSMSRRARISHGVYAWVKMAAELKRLKNDGSGVVTFDQHLHLYKVNAHGTSSIGQNESLLTANKSNVDKEWYYVGSRVFMLNDGKTFFVQCNIFRGKTECRRRYFIGDFVVSVPLTNRELNNWRSVDKYMKAEIFRIVYLCGSVN